MGVDGEEREDFANSLPWLIEQDGIVHNSAGGHGESVVLELMRPCSVSLNFSLFPHCFLLFAFSPIQVFDLVTVVMI